MPENFSLSREEKGWQDQQFISTTPFFGDVRRVLFEDYLAQSTKDQGQQRVSAESDEEYPEVGHTFPHGLAVLTQSSPSFCMKNRAGRLREIEIR